MVVVFLVDSLNLSSVFDKSLHSVTRYGGKAVGDLLNPTMEAAAGAAAQSAMKAVFNRKKS